MVPFAAGGDADVFARRIGEASRDKLGQAILVENRVGGAGLTMWPALTSAAPDGYTLAFIAITQAQLPALFKIFPADWYRMITPVMLTYKSVVLVLGSAASPAKTFGEVLAYARANPDKLNVGVVGRFLPGDLLQQMAGIRLHDISYKGVADANTALLANDIQVLFGNLGFAKPYIDAKRIIPLATLSATRSAYMPDVPAVSEYVPGYDAPSWMAIIGPSGLAPDVVAKLSDVFGAAFKTPELRKFSQDLGVEVVTATPEETARYLESETRKWTKAAQDAHVEAQ
jgi:tripartite-type tricarboxylate transporter receptor subunit TctC